MSDPKLTVQYDRTKMLYYLAWYDDEDGQGGEIDIDGHAGPEPTDRDHWEHWTACMVASQDYCAEARVFTCGKPKRSLKLQRAPFERGSRRGVSFRSGRKRL